MHLSTSYNVSEQDTLSAVAGSGMPQILPKL